MKKYFSDVVIVGAGPAGSSLAYTLAKLGRTVIIIDKKQIDEIGDKVCGDALSPAYYEIAHEKIGFPLPPKSAIEYCDQITLLDKNQEYSLSIPFRTGTIDRGTYGQIIVKNLHKIGVTILADTRFSNVLIDDNMVCGIECTLSGTKLQIHAKVTVDASGTHSIVRSRLPKAIASKMGNRTVNSNRFVAYRQIIETANIHDYQKELVITNQPELDELGAAYYWMFSKGSRRLNVGLGYLMLDENRGNNIKELSHKITERLFPGAYTIKERGDQIPARLPLHSCVANGFLVIGDAAGLANPVNGEGHGPALEAGIACGKILNDILDTEDITEEVLWEYNKYIWDYFGKLYSWGIAVIKVMNRYGAVLIDDLLKSQIITEDMVHIIINDTDPSLPVWHIIRKGWRKPGLLWSMLKIVRHANKIITLADNYPDYSVEEFYSWSQKMVALEY